MNLVSIVGVVATMGLVCLVNTARAQDDVEFGFAVSMGGSSTDIGTGIAVDASGNVYTIGYFINSVDFDPGENEFVLSSLGGNDIFVQKLDANGNFVWAKSMGGTENDFGYAIAVDASGNVYTTGNFIGTVDFDQSPDNDAFITSQNGVSSDIFVQKLDTDGDFVWAKAMGGTGSDFGRGIAVDGAGNLQTTGFFEGTADFDPDQTNMFELSSQGSSDIFVQRLDTDGNFVWAKAMGGTGLDRCFGVAVDASGNVYATGFFSDTANFNPGEAGGTHTSRGGFDVFVLKLNTFGDFQWAVRRGDSGTDIGLGVAVDVSGNVLSTGSFSGTVDFDLSVAGGELDSNGGTDAFVQKLNSDGNAQWATSIGGMNADIGYGVALDPSGNVYTTGEFNGAVDFDPALGVENEFEITSAGLSDIFVQRLDTDGLFVFAKAMGGTDSDQGLGIAIDASSNVHTTGRYSIMADFDPSANAADLSSVGG